MNSIKLTINKREFDFSFGLGFLGELLDDLEMSIDEIGDRMSKNPFKTIPAMMFHSAAFSLKRKGKDVDFDVYDFTEWIDKDGGLAGENIIKFCNAFNESLVKGVPKEEEVEQKGAKKK